MKPKVREPFFITRAMNFLLGIVILALVVVTLVMKTNTEIYQMIIFVLASIMNFVGATISFSESKRVRGNIYAIVCGMFLVVALILALRYFVFV